MAYIDIKGLSYSYPDERDRALKDVSLEIEKGEIFLLMGDSGSGKSTLLKCISGAIPYFYGGTLWGKIEIQGKAVENMTHQERAGTIGMIFQDPERQLLMNKVHREIAFGLENIGVEEKNIKRRVWEALQFSNIQDIALQDINTLSGGQKQRVAITSAVAGLPQCILLDEPTSQLDPSSAEEVVELIKKINDELGITIVVVEQRVDRWFQICDRIGIMKDGMLSFVGTREELYLSDDEYLRGFLPTRLKLSKALGIEKMPLTIRETRRALGRFEFRLKEDKHKGSSKCILSIKNLYCGYGNEEILRGINLLVNEGDFIGIFGPNGAGKSTLLKSIMGLLKYSGSIRIMDKEVKNLGVRDIALISGYVSQNPNDYISKDTVYDELKFTLDNYGIKDDGVIDITLKDLNIYELRHKNPRDISGGERQRVAIASILVLKPKLLLLDEPTRGLDFEAKRKLGRVLKSLNKNGTTIILITHDVDFASEFCDRFGIIFNGEIVSIGTREEVLSESIYYTTEINKLLRDKNKRIFSLEQALSSVRR